MNLSMLLHGGNVLGLLLYHFKFWHSLFGEIEFELGFVKEIGGASHAFKSIKFELWDEMGGVWPSNISCHIFNTFQEAWLSMVFKQGITSSFCNVVLSLPFSFDVVVFKFSKMFYSRSSNVHLVSNYEYGYVFSNVL